MDLYIKNTWAISDLIEYLEAKNYIEFENFWKQSCTATDPLDDECGAELPLDRNSGSATTNQSIMTNLYLKKL